MAQRSATELPDPHYARTVAVNKETDFDYYATYSESLFNQLIEQGWLYTASDVSYYDSEALHILQKDNHQIVLRKDAEFYRRVFENIPIWFYHDFLWKSNGEMPQCDRQRIQPIFEVLFTMARQ